MLGPSSTPLEDRGLTLSNWDFTTIRKGPYEVASTKYGSVYFKRGDMVNSTLKTSKMYEAYVFDWYELEMRWIGRCWLNENYFQNGVNIVKVATMTKELDMGNSDHGSIADALWNAGQAIAENILEGEEDRIRWW